MRKVTFVRPSRVHRRQSHRLINEASEKHRLFVALIQHIMVAFMPVTDLLAIDVENQTTTIRSVIRAPEFDGEIVLPLGINLKRERNRAAIVRDRSQRQQLSRWFTQTGVNDFLLFVCVSP